MSSAQLSDEELRQAAAEAGISPKELRQALAERSSTLPARVDRNRSLVGPPKQGLSEAFVEGRVGLPPGEAIDALRGSIERQTGMGGHKMGDDGAAVVDDQRGITYRVRSEDDGSGGALVRVDVDSSQGKGTQTLMTTGVAGISLTVLLLGWLFSATTLLVGGLGIGGLGAFLIVRHASRLRAAVKHAEAIAAHGLVETEDRTPIGGAGEPAKALPPADR